MAQLFRDSVGIRGFLNSLFFKGAFLTLERWKPPIKLPGLLLSGCILFLPLPVLASFGFNLDGSLDRGTISKAYFEGDFSRILPPLETWRQGIAENKTREDSIFVFKYLSVIYAANPATKEKSRSFMFQLLSLAPTIEILDMYASDEIERAFRDVKKEFKERNAYVSTHDHLGNERRKTPETGQATSEKKDSKFQKWIWWGVGGIGMAAVAVGAYFLLSEEPPAEKSFEP